MSHYRRSCGFTEGACTRYRLSILAPLHLSTKWGSCSWTGSGRWRDDISFQSLWRRRSVLCFGSVVAAKAVGRAELRKLHQASERRVSAELGGACGLLWIGIIAQINLRAKDRRKAGCYAVRGTGERALPHSPFRQMWIHP